MQKHNLQQGTPEWHAFRLNHNGASEAAAMLGLSKKTMRNELLHMKSTGTAKEFSDYVQKHILDYGHEVEAMARPLMEEILGEDLYPITCSEGQLSASCDGLSLSGETALEHKQWNEQLAAQVAIGIVPDEHQPQCQQILMVTGAKRVIFTVSDGTLDNLVYTEVLPDPSWFARISAGWEQFNKDRETFKYVEILEKPKAEATIELPALFVHAKGEITDSNMKAYGEALAIKLAEVRAIALVTDQDFSNAKEAAKMFREQCKKLELTKEAMLSQTVSIGEAARMMDLWHEDLRITALQLEKDVEKEDLAKKRAMVSAGQDAYQAHCAQLQDALKGSGIAFTADSVDFAASIKRKSSYTSMQDAIDTALANGKIAADAKAKDLRDKIKWFKENGGSQHQFLFADLQHIVAKPMDDFALVVSSRIDKHKADEADRLEAERARIQAEEEVKARAKVEAEAKLQAEAIAKAEAIKAEQQRKDEAAKHVTQSEPVATAAPVVESAAPVKLKQVAARPTRPTRIQMIEAIATAFNLNYSVAEQVMREEFAEVAA